METYDNKSLQELSELATIKFGTVFPETFGITDAIEWMKIHDIINNKNIIAPEQIPPTMTVNIPQTQGFNDVFPEQENIPSIINEPPELTAIKPLFPQISPFMPPTEIYQPPQIKYLLNDDNTLNLLHGNIAVEWDTGIDTLLDVRNQTNINEINLMAVFQEKILHPDYAVRKLPFIPMNLPLFPTNFPLTKQEIPRILGLVPPNISIPTNQPQLVTPVPQLVTPVPQLVTPVPQLVTPIIQSPVVKPIVIAAPVVKPIVIAAPVIKPVVIQPTIAAPVIKPVVIQPTIAAPVIKPVVIQPTIVAPVIKPVVIQPTIAAPVIKPVVIQPTIAAPVVIQPAVIAQVIKPAGSPVIKPITPKVAVPNKTITLKIADTGKGQNIFGPFIQTPAAINPQQKSPGVTFGTGGLTSIKTTMLSPTIPNIFNRQQFPAPLVNTPGLHAIKMPTFSTLVQPVIVPVKRPAEIVAANTIKGNHLHEKNENIMSVLAEIDPELLIAERTGKNKKGYSRNILLGFAYRMGLVTSGKGKQELIDDIQNIRKEYGLM